MNNQPENGSRRKLRRRHLIYYLYVYDDNTEKLLGRLVDLTTEGVMLLSEDSIPEDKYFRLKMILPEKIRDRENIIFEAKSLWCQKDVNPNFHVTGFQIENITDKDIRVIESLIFEFSFSD